MIGAHKSFATDEKVNMLVIDGVDTKVVEFGGKEGSIPDPKNPGSMKSINLDVGKFIQTEGLETLVYFPNVTDFSLINLKDVPEINHTEISLQKQIDKLTLKASEQELYNSSNLSRRLNEYKDLLENVAPNLIKEINGEESLNIIGDVMLAEMDIELEKKGQKVDISHHQMDPTSSTFLRKYILQKRLIEIYTAKMIQCKEMASKTDEIKKEMREMKESNHKRSSKLIASLKDANQYAEKASDKHKEQLAIIDSLEQTNQDLLTQMEIFTNLGGASNKKYQDENKMMIGELKESQKTIEQLRKRVSDFENQQNVVDVIDSWKVEDDSPQTAPKTSKKKKKPTVKTVSSGVVVSKEPPLSSPSQETPEVVVPDSIFLNNKEQQDLLKTTNIELTACKSTNVILSTENERLASRVDQLREEVDGLKRKLTTFVSPAVGNAQLSEMQNKLSSQINTNKQIQINNKQTSDRVKTENVKLMAQVEHLSRELQTVNTTLKLTTQAATDSTSLLTKIDSQKQQVNNLQSEVSALKQSSSKQQSEILNRINQHNAIQARNEALLSENNNLKMTVENGSVSTDNKKHHEQEIIKFKENITTLVASNNDLRSQLMVSVNTNNNNLITQHLTQTARVNDLNFQLNDSQNACDVLFNERNEFAHTLTETNNELNLAKQRIASLEIELVTARSVQSGVLLDSKVSEVVVPFLPIKKDDSQHTKEVEKLQEMLQFYKVKLTKSQNEKNEIEFELEKAQQIIADLKTK